MGKLLDHLGLELLEIEKHTVIRKIPNRKEEAERKQKRRKNLCQWVSVKDRLPEVGPIKGGAKGWLVRHGGREYYTRNHPSWWNMNVEYDNGTKGDPNQVDLWLEVDPPEGNDNG